MEQVKKIINIFKEYINKYRKYFLFLFLLLIIEGIVAAASVIAVVPLADFLLDQSLHDPSRITSFMLNMFDIIGIPINFWIFSAFFVGFNLLNGVLKTGIKYSILKLKYKILRGIFDETITGFFNARWGFFSENSQGSLLNTMNKELTIVGDTIGHIATQFAQIIQLVIYLSIPFLLNAPMTIIAITLAIIFGMPFLRLNKISYTLGKANTKTANIAMGILNEIMQSARIILGFGRQAGAKLQYLNAFDAHMDVTIKSQTLGVAVSNLFAPLGILASVVALGFAIEQQESISELTAVMWSLLSALPILSALLRTNISINNFIPSYEQLLLLRNRAEEYTEIEGEKEFDKLEDGIKFQSVIFSYPGRKNTINSIDLFIKKGEMLALVGESGSGKSTITDLLLGLQIPASGSILIDNEPLSCYRQNSFREKIGYVPQEPILFHTTVRENLLWAYDTSDESELWSALSMANAEEFVKELPYGIDTVVGDRGVRMSGGQRQRIALARALLRKPELLILDEATSALDTESEILIQNSIEKLAHNTTILIVAHRLSTIKQADQVCVMQNGKIIESGSYKELKSNKMTVFYKMLEKQGTNLVVASYR